MDHPFGERNQLCLAFGHPWRRRYTGRDGISRWTCSLCGHTEPPFRKVQQFPPYDYLPDDRQPPGAV